MKEKKNNMNSVSEENSENETLNEEVSQETVDDKKADACEKTSDIKKENKKLKEENEKLRNELLQSNDKYLRMMAEYDNFRKRSAKEREGIYADACSDVIGEMLAVFDDIERATQYTETDKLSEGFKIILKSFADTLNKLGIEEIDTNNGFDPNQHNAVSHIDDDSLGENVVAEVFQKGYKKGDKIIRYAMVKVAN